MYKKYTFATGADKPSKSIFPSNRMNLFWTFFEIVLECKSHTKQADCGAAHYVDVLNIHKKQPSRLSQSEVDHEAL